MDRPQVGVGVVVISDGKLLIGKRTNSHGHGTWATPGGKLEFGENVLEAAKRELFEETGLTAELVRRGPWTNDLIDGNHYVTLFVFVSKFSGTLENREPHKCEGWEWRALGDVPKPLFQTLKTLFTEHPLEHHYAYLACPYTHPDPEIREARVEKVTDMAFQLFSQGISVYSPLTHATQIAKRGLSETFSYWESFDLGMVSRSHKVLVLTLPGWEESKGVQAEIRHARSLGIPVEELTPLDS